MSCPPSLLLLLPSSLLLLLFLLLLSSSSWPAVGPHCWESQRCRSSTTLSAPRDKLLTCEQVSQCAHILNAQSVAAFIRWAHAEA